MIKKYIISMSGGKDSTYMCHHVLEDFLKQGRLHEISGAIVFLSDWEFPQLIDHIHKVEENINAFLCANSITNEFGQRHTIRFYYEWTSFEYYMCDHQVANKTHKGLGWPHDVRKRWCTGYKQMAIRRGITKVKRDVRNLYKSNGIDLKYRDIEICSMIGICIDEPSRLRLVHDRTYPLADAQIKSSDCLSLCINKYGYDFNHLYDYFSRTGCFCCPRKSWKEISVLRLNFPELYSKALEMDARQSKPFKQKKKLEDFERDKIRTMNALQRRINKLNGG